MHSGDRWRLGHRPGLDGVRGFALLFVLCAHLGVPGMHYFGPAGVTVFFALSGFLITALLLDERDRSGTVSLGRFYVRRAARLAPALILCVTGVVAAELLTTGRVADAKYALGALTWTSNFVILHSGWAAGSTGPLSHTWSLAVEEQFYLLWPVLLIVAARLCSRRQLLALAVWGTVISFASTGGGSWAHHYLMLDSRACQLLSGATLAIWLSGRPAHQVRAGWALPGAVVVIALTLTGLVGRVPAIPFGIALATTSVLFVAAQSRVAWLEVPPLRWVGERAYGLYLYPVPIVHAVQHLVGGPWWVIAALSLAASLVVAWASYRWVEQPVRSLARRAQDKGWIAAPSHQPDVAVSTG